MHCNLKGEGIKVREANGFPTSNLDRSGELRGTGSQCSWTDMCTCFQILNPDVFTQGRSIWETSFISKISIVISNSRGWPDLYRAVVLQPFFHKRVGAPVKAMRQENIKSSEDGAADGLLKL